MNPGPIEEGSKVASSLFEAMKAQPMTLAILLFGIAMIVLIYIGTGEWRTQNKEVMAELLSQHKAMVDLLSRCIVPTPPTL